jgi:protein subunit release factor A
VFAATKNKDRSWDRKIDDQTEHKEIQVLYKLVNQARDQWQLAREYFEFVKDPELVDLAINNLEAAERRYNYLLKQLREE